MQLKIVVVPISCILKIANASSEIIAFRECRSDCTKNTSP